MEATGLLNLCGATIVVAVALVRFRPIRVRGRSRVKREAFDVDLAQQHPLRVEAAVDRGNRGEEPMAMTTQLPRGTANEPAATAAPPTGLPSEQLYTWLEWVQDDLRRLEARLDYLETARTQLQEQERLLTELLRASGSLSRS